MTATGPDRPGHPTRRLDGAELAAWWSFGGLLLRLPAALDTRLQRACGLSHFEHRVLSTLAEAPHGTRRMSELAALADGSLSRLSHVIKRLEARGWVRREASRRGGRHTDAVLTDAGWHTVAATAPGHADAVRALFLDALTAEELDRLGDIARRVLTRLPEGPGHRRGDA